MLLQSGPVGGVNGTTVTAAGSSAYGDAFATVTSTSATFVIDTSTAAYSAQSYKLSTSATSVVCNATWTYTAAATIQERLYFKATDFTSTQNAGLRLRAGATQACRITFDSAGHVQVKNTTNGTVAAGTGSVALSVGTWYRLEVTCTQGASGSVSWQVFDLATETLVDSVSGATGNYGTANISESGFGFFTATSNINPWWFAQVATSDAGTFPIGRGGQFIALTESGTLTDGLGVVTGGSTAVPLTDTGTLTDSLSLIMSLPIALSDTATMSQTFNVATAVPPIGVPFRQDIFGSSARFAVEAAWGADLTANPSTWTWFDITSDVMYNPGISCTFGRADETSQSQPSAATFSLLNIVGSYSEFVTTGIYGAGVRKGTPMRVRKNLGTGWVVEFQGRAYGLTPTWDTTGTLPIVQVTAAGTLRRLGQPQSPPVSALTAQITSTAPAWFWPMEDGSTSTSFASAIAGVPALSTTGTVAFGAQGAPGGAASGDFSGGGSASVNPPTVPSTFELHLGFAFSPADTGAQTYNALKFSLGTGSSQGTLWVVTPTVNADGSGTINLSVQGPTTSISGTVLTTPAATWNPGTWHWIQLDLVQNGGGFNVDVTVTVDDVVTFGSSLVPLVTMSRATQLVVSPGRTVQTPTGISQVATSNNFKMQGLAVWSAVQTADFYQGTLGFTGEDPVTRMTRICGQAGITLTVTGTSDLAMGPQLLDSTLANLRDCENSDVGGILFDGFDDGVRFISRSARYNAAASLTVDAGVSSQLAPPFAPVSDDQRLVNQYTASRSGGGSATVTDTSSALAAAAVGTYAQSGSFNLAGDSPLPGIAGWRVSLGTVAGLRYPTLSINFINALAAALAPNWLAQAAGSYPVSFRADVTNVATSARNHPPGTLMLIFEGYTSRTTNLEWSIQANCSAWLPNNVLTVSSTTRGRVQAAATTLTNAITATFTGTVTVTTPYPWTRAAGDFPMAVDFNGEEVTVSAIGVWAGNHQSMTVTARSVNGVVTNHVPGERVGVWQPAEVAL